jgi:hypothetical protein
VQANSIFCGFHFSLQQKASQSTTTQFKPLKYNKVNTNDNVHTSGWQSHLITSIACLEVTHGHTHTHHVNAWVTDKSQKIGSTLTVERHPAQIKQEK